MVQRVVGFKKIKLHSGENVGYGEVSQPERQMHTTALWLNPPARRLSRAGRPPAELAEAALGLRPHAALGRGADADERRAGPGPRGGRRPLGLVRRLGPRQPRRLSIPDMGSPTTGRAPTIFLFDRYPGGTGLAERLFDLRGDLLRRARAMVHRCACQRGCPACIGPGSTAEAKALAGELLTLMIGTLDEERGQPLDLPPGASCDAALQVSP